MQCTFDAFGLAVAIQSDREGLETALQRLLPAFPRTDRTSAVTYRLLIDRRGAYVLIKERRTLRVTPDFALALAVLVQDLQTTIARVAHGWTLVHAGVVAIGEAALVLPGRPGAGKSTLVAALLRAGAAYASDEFAVLDVSGRVWPYSRWLALRAADGERRIPATTLTADVVDRPLRVGTMLFTEFESGARFNPRTLSRAEGVLRLLAHCPGARARPAETLAALRAATAGAAVCETARGEAEDAARVLMTAASRIQSASETT